MTRKKKRLEKFEFDYWGYFSHCVKSLNIAPSEVWRLDFDEISHLLDDKQEEKQDLSFMLWHKRKMNGATKEWQLSSSL